MIDNRTKREVDRMYKHWLEEQIEDDPIITATCKHCQEEINLGDGGFMSWSYGELGDHMENCEEINLDNVKLSDIQKRPDGFDDDGHNYGYSG
jgi:hypothetical protein